MSKKTSQVKSQSKKASLEESTKQIEENRVEE